MTILPAGTFRVSDYRKPIPERVKRAALIIAARGAWLRLGGLILPDTDSPDEAMAFMANQSGFGHWLAEMEAAAIIGKIQFDHRPALENRPYDTEARDFIPPQHDPTKIDPILGEEHKARTSGATGQPYRGDVPMRARTRNLANKTEDQRERAAAKAGQAYERRSDIPAPTKKSRKPKAKIRNRSNWPKGRKIAKRPKKEKPRKPPVGRFS